MAIEPKSESVLSGRVSALENEIPSYRAISTLAVASLLLGLVSILNVATLWFLIASGAAVLLGVLALKRIARFPDLLTGASLAKSGIVLGVVFGLAATTTSVVQDLVLKSKASGFAKQFAKIVKEREFPDVAWFHIHPETRKDKSGVSLIEEARKSSRDPSMFQQEFAGMIALKSAVDERKLDIQYDHLALAGSSELVPFAAAVYKLTGKDVTTPEYAMASLKGYEKNGRIEWMVEQVVYPYQLGTAQAPVPKIDDGHGHGGGDSH